MIGVIPKDIKERLKEKANKSKNPSKYMQICEELWLLSETENQFLKDVI